MSSEPGTRRQRSPKLAPEPSFAEGHEHSEQCDALYEEWKRYHGAVIDPAGLFSRQEQLLARHEREKFERLLLDLGCSGHARRRVERDAEIAEHGHPLLP